MHTKYPKLILAAALILSLLLSACSNQQPEETQEEDAPFTVTVCAGEAQDTLDPAASTAQGGKTSLFHRFANLVNHTGRGGKL